jgi:hypothetical protein
VKELMRCAYLDNRESVILIGNPGTGKTHVATALGGEACGRGKRVQFWKVTELITHLIEAREERQLARMKKQLARLDLLILDELGYVPTSKLGAELLFDVISTAYERTSLIVTTNLPSRTGPRFWAASGSPVPPWIGCAQHFCARPKRWRYTAASSLTAYPLTDPHHALEPSAAGAGCCSVWRVGRLRVRLSAAVARRL